MKTKSCLMIRRPTLDSRRFTKKQPPKSREKRKIAAAFSSIDHLLISSIDRNAIFSSRLLQLLKIGTFEPSKSSQVGSTNYITSRLWKLASADPKPTSLLSKTTYYVNSLLHILNPTWNEHGVNRLRLSQIPGRGPSSQKQKFPLPLSPACGVTCNDSGPANSLEECKQELLQIHSEMELSCHQTQPHFAKMLARMVGNPICSDLSICLDSGASVPAHRFILATWDPELAILRDNTNCISAPGLSRTELLDLLSALYTFDLTALSSLTAKAEFTLDCWQMLDVVRSRLSGNKSAMVAATPGKDIANLPTPPRTSAVFSFSPVSMPISPQSPKPVNEWDNRASSSSFDLFASSTDNLNNNDPLDAGTRSNPSPRASPLNSTTIARQSSEQPDPEVIVIEADSPIGPGICDPDPEAVETVATEEDPPVFDLASHCCLEGTPGVAAALPSVSGEQSTEPNDCEASVGSRVTPGRTNCRVACDAEVAAESIFSDESVVTPAPLAKRLRMTVDLDETERSLSLSQPLVGSLDLETGEGDGGGDGDNDCVHKLACEAVFRTPSPNARHSGRRVSSVISTNVPITPKPAFDQMRTPELKKALSDYGVRHLPKKKAVQLLDHIYDELHPFVDTAAEPHEMDVCVTSTTKPLASSHARVTDVRKNEFPVEESMNSEEPSYDVDVDVADPTPSTSATRVDPSENASRRPVAKEAQNEAIKRRVWECLRSNDETYYKIVTYVVG
uniref:BTB domain-containing protein n=1 Tax=Mesocestoides corti TaxID=53468 RepID=A0A5K3FNN6_MESCO